VLERLQEASRVSAVDQPVVVAERQVAHRPDGDHVVYDDHTLVHRADAKNRHLRLADDRQTEQRAENAWVRDRERAALDFFRLELFAARTRRQVLNGPAGPQHVALVRAANDRYDQSLLERDGNAEVDVFLVDDVLAVDRGVRERELPDRVDRGLRDERRVGELRTGRLVPGLVLQPDLVDAPEVHFVRRIHMR